MICDTILDAVGHTPLVRLGRMTTPDMAEILVKFEALNVGGSIKTRTALNMIRWMSPHCVKETFNPSDAIAYPYMSEK